MTTPEETQKNLGGAAKPEHDRPRVVHVRHESSGAEFEIEAYGRTWFVLIEKPGRDAPGAVAVQTCGTNLTKRMEVQGVLVPMDSSRPTFRMEVYE